MSHEPANGESSVPRNRVIRMGFNEDVLPASVHDQSILVRIGGTFQTRPPGTFKVTGDVVEFDPSVTEAGTGNAMGFGAGEQVLVQIPLKTAIDGIPEQRFVRNLSGDPVTIASGTNSFSFLTGSNWDDPVPGRPEIVGLEFSPVPDAQGRVTSSAAVTVVFSEPVDPSTFGLGKNIFLTNDSPAAGAVYQKDIPSLVIYDGSLTRYTLTPVFGFGQGPYDIRVGFVDPDATVFFIDNPPRDLVGNPIINTTFFLRFSTLFDPVAPVFGVLSEDFLTTTNRDALETDALWGNAPEFPNHLVGQPITKRSQRVDIATITGKGGGKTVIDNWPAGLGEEDYCPAQNPLVGSDSIIKNPPASDGRRQLNLYRQAELGARGAIVRVAWGPDSDATFAATYPGTIVRLGHKRAGTNFTSSSLFGQFDVNGYVTVSNAKDYQVPQRFDVNGGAKNDGYLDWPKFDVVFEYDGKSDLILDVEARMGNTYQTMRTFLGAAGIQCTCFNIAACNTNFSLGFRQMDTVYGSDSPNPAFPTEVVTIAEFEFASLLSDAQSLYYDTGVPNPDFISPLVTPLVQAGGASIELTWSASFDGIVEDVPFTPNISLCDGHRYIRWHCLMRSNLFTGARPRLEVIQVPYLIP